MSRSSLTLRTTGPLALVISLFLVGCASTSPSPSASSVPSASVESSLPASEPASAEPSVTATSLPSDEPSDSPVPFACTASVTVPKTTDRAQITAVRVGTHDGYDRVTFEFAAGIPLTTIAGVLGPLYADASGLPLDVAGTIFLQVTINGGTKVSDGGLTYAGPTNFEPGFDRLLQLREGGDVEAVSTWYLGLDEGGCYRVITLTGPSRLVIDVEH